jgi:hypothetical protein
MVNIISNGSEPSIKADKILTNLISMVIESPYGWRIMKSADLGGQPDNITSWHFKTTSFTLAQA